MFYYKFIFKNFEYPFNVDSIIDPLYDFYDNVMIFKSESKLNEVEGLSELTESEYEIIKQNIIEIENSKRGDLLPPEPSETELLTEYLLEVDFRVAMLELGLI